ncbi:MAG: LamG domain-containing protein [Bacteroidales bacterium]|nr:LamG domain-containing protein [Bacteroidales bacterium]
MKRISLILVLILWSFAVWSQQYLVRWTFDADQPAIDRATGTRDTLIGFYDRVSGVSGNAVQLDGFSSYLGRSHFGMDLPGEFTVNAWVALGAYPWFRCPVFDLRAGAREGILLAVKRDGTLTAGMGLPIHWVELNGPRIPLKEWVLLSLTVHQGGVSKLFLNGQKVAQTDPCPVLRFTRRNHLTIGRNALLEPWWDYQYTVKDHFSFLDGIVDEVGILNDTLSEDAIAEIYKAGQPLPSPGFQTRVLPAGPAGKGSFGAYYTRLHYTRQWDRLWRVGDDPDILVRFDQSNCRLVFWRGTSYVPCWVTENGIWYTNEWTETWGADVSSCAEPLMDRDCRYGSVRIIENTPARVVVHWRYGLVDSDYHFVAKDVDGKGEWTDEYYIIYPDGIGIRKIELHYSKPLRKHDWEESIVLLSPGQYPDEVISDPEVTLVNMKGQTHDYSWRHDLPVEMKEPAVANIHVVNLKSRYKPFYIVSPEPFESAEGKFDAPFFRSYSAVLGKNYHPDSVPSIYGWWNHWPVAQVPGDGRWVVTNDRASHFNLTTFTQWKDYAMDDRTKTRIMLHGLSDMAPEQLVPLANSWLNPPELTRRHGGLVPYEPAERAYILDSVTANYFTGMLHATAERPAVRPAIVLKGIKSEYPAVVLNSMTLQPDVDYRSGIVHELTGWKTIIWIDRMIDREVRIQIY